ncbi:polyprenyl synthetase family protein, partial [bacterium]|nr:polyprenyl synthetase family protein [bacterium]
ATLLHDDVVDNAEIRRSKKAARSIWGNEISVLVGDYLFAVSFQYLSNLEDPELVKALSGATTTMARGEIIQLGRDNATSTEKDYLDIILYKTASLMGSSMSIGGMIGGADQEQKKALYDCGIEIGMAFQMVDDALDYDIGNVDLGKEQGTDLKERKITLPLSHLLEKASKADKNIVKGILNCDIITDEHVVQVCQLMKQYGSAEYTLRQAQKHADDAKNKLIKIPKNEYRTGIEQLADFIIRRKK